MTPDLSPLIDTKRVVNFQFVQLFSYCKDEDGNFQALYMLYQKPKSALFLIMVEFLMSRGPSWLQYSPGVIK